MRTTLLFATFVACVPVRTPVTDADAGVVDAGVDAFDPGPSCASACAHLLALGCSEGREPSCEPTCVAAVGVVLPASWTSCVVGASGPAELAACRVECGR